MATNNNASKYDYITCKELIHKGSPTIYKLRPKKQNIGPLKRMTLGVKNPNKTNKTILLVGETGAGKSTLINALVNFAIGVKWEDDVWFKMIEEKKKDQSESQTSDVIVYEIFGFEDQTLPFSLTIIDTPGYGNTEGIEKDVIVSQRLLDLFRSVDGVHEIDVVGLVLKATECRLSDRLSYIFNSVMSLFGKEVEKNIVALMTHSNGRTPKNALKALEAANIKCARNEKNQLVHFLFDNCQNEDRTDDEEDLQRAYDMSMTGMTQFTAFLQKILPQKLETTVNVLNERITLTACIQNLQERIKSILDKQNEIQQTQGGLKKHEQEMKNNEEFTIEVDEPYKDKERIEGGWWWLMFFEGAVCCTVCEENCHFPGCTMAHTPSLCEVMTRGRCTVCTKKCPPADHVKENWRFVNKTRKVKKTLQDVKKKYENNKVKNEKMSHLESLHQEMEDLEENKTHVLDDAYKHVVKLELMALKVVSVSTYVHLDFLIEEMEKKEDTEKLQKLKEMASKKDEGVKYIYGKLIKRK